MAFITHHKDFRVSMIWQNAAKPSTDGSAITADWDLISSYSALTSQALPVEGLSFFSMNPTTRRVNRQTGSRHRTLKDTWNDLKGSIPGVTLSLPATQETIDLFLYLAMQRCSSEGASTPYVKAFELPVITGATWPSGRFPEFNNNEGAFCGLVWSYAHTSGHFSNLEEILLGAVCTELRLTCHSEEHDGELWIEADFIGRYFDEGITFTGTITAASEEDTTKFHINDLGIHKLYDIVTPLYGFGFTINTGAKFLPFPGVYDATSNAIAAQDCLLNHSVTGYVDFLVDDLGTSTFGTARTYLQIQAVETTNQIAWGDGTTSTTGELDFTWQMQPTNLTPVGSDESRFRLEFDCLETSSNNLFKANVANALERGW